MDESPDMYRSCGMAKCSFEAYLMLPPSAFNSQCETNVYKALLVDHIVSVCEPHETYFYMSILKAQFFHFQVRVGLSRFISRSTAPNNSFKNQVVKKYFYLFFHIQFQFLSLVLVEYNNLCMCFHFLLKQFYSVSWLQHSLFEKMSLSAENICALNHLRQIIVKVVQEIT